MIYLHINVFKANPLKKNRKNTRTFPSEMPPAKDALGHTFNTRLENVFVIGQGSKPWISLPKASLLWGKWGVKAAEKVFHGCLAICFSILYGVMMG